MALAGRIVWLVVALVCLPVGSALAWQYGPPEDLRAECEQGEAESCYLAGQQYRDGLDACPRDLAKAMDFFELACQKGMASICYQAGTDLMAGNLYPKDPKRAAALLEAGCKQAHPHCCYYLGLQLKEGRGVPADPARAEAIHLDNCIRGFSWSCDECSHSRYVDHSYLVPGLGYDGQDLMLNVLAHTTGSPYDFVSWYAEAEGYRTNLLVPTGLALRVLGLRLRSDTAARSIGFYLANGAYGAWTRVTSTPATVGAKPKEELKLDQYGLDSNAKVYLRYGALPALVAGLRANAGTADFLELRVALENGTWGDFLSKKLGFAIEYQRRFGTPWSSQSWDDQTLIGSLRFSTELMGK